MPRPPKERNICKMPRVREFVPVGAEQAQRVVLCIDEYEALRLIDLLGLSQEECAARMQVARTTVQAVYESARRKLAEALVCARPLHIEGGAFHLCDGSGVCPECARRSNE